MTPTEFKAQYRLTIAPKLDKVKDPTPELLKAIIDLERMVAELKDCACGPAPANPYYSPKTPDWFEKLSKVPEEWPPPFLPPREYPWKLPEVWCRTGDRNGVVG